MSALRVSPRVVLRNGLYRAEAWVEHSLVRVVSDSLSAVYAAIRSFEEAYRELLPFLAKNPLFLRSLSPIELGDDAPKVAKSAAEAAAEVGVGPMAALPGALADNAVEHMLRSGARVCVVENGGEISVQTERAVTVKVVPGGGSGVGWMLMRIEPSDTPMGIATSSNTLGGGLSLGEADAAVVVADAAAIADAAATAVCNAVRGKDVTESVKRSMEEARKLPIRGALVVRRGYVGVFGKPPQILHVEKG